MLIKSIGSFRYKQSFVVLGTCYYTLNKYFKKSCHNIRFLKSSNLNFNKINLPNMSGSGRFCILDYDCIGFDLDNTVCEYNVRPIVEMEYFALAHYLCQERSYKPEVLLKPWSDAEVDFIQRGLMLDFSRGNIIKVSEDGTIIKACHGTRELDSMEIIEAYGPDKKWEVTNEFCRDMISTWNGPCTGKLRTLLDYFDMPASLVFARAVDSIDEDNDGREINYAVGKDVLSALIHVYNRDNFKSEKSEYFKNLKAEPSKYINTCDPNVIQWLKELKKSKFTYLLTGSNVDYAASTATQCLGEDWLDLFDIVICFARKPGFFISRRPFYTTQNCKEGSMIDASKLEKQKVYNQGNWPDLYSFVARTLRVPRPKCLYFGDNLVQDIYTPSHYCSCDTVAVVEEMLAEGMCNQVNLPPHQSQSCLVSSKWGSYFHCGFCNVDTVWGSIIKKHSKFCIPSLKFIAKLPLDTEFNVHEHGVFYPSCPLSLTPSQPCR